MSFLSTFKIWRFKKQMSREKWIFYFGRNWMVQTIIFLILIHSAFSQERGRATDLDIDVGILPHGPFNAITDVTGVRVGHVTIIRADSIRTGVTAILPHSGNIFQSKVPGAIYVGNGFGKLAGSTQVAELGQIETPIVLTNTLSVGTAVKAVVDYSLRLPGNERVGSVNAVVGETNDGGLNHIQGFHVKESDVWRAIESADTGPVPEGCVGAGTGTTCFGWKGGIGTSSRKLPSRLGGWTVGVLVQTNFGGVLQINGAPVGRELGKYAFRGHIQEKEQEQENGSCMIVVATDAPLLHRNLKRLAARAILGLARTGGFCSNGSGDYVIAFSTHPDCRMPYRSGENLNALVQIRNDRMSPLFLAVVEATEEAIYNSMFQATTMTGRRGRISDAIPLDLVREICEKYGVLNLKAKLPVE